MTIIWEGPVEHFLHRSTSIHDPDFTTERILWYSDWTHTRNYDEFAQCVKRYDRFKAEGPWNFKPQLYVTLDDDMTFPKGREIGRRIESCSGLSRSGVNGVVTAWYDARLYEAYDQIQRYSTLTGLLSVLTTNQRNDKLPSSDLIEMMCNEEAEIRAKGASPQLQDYLMPSYVWAKRKPPFEYHRKGTMMAFHIEALPSEGILARHRTQKACPVFMVNAKAMGIWFDNASLALEFRLKYTSELSENGVYGMRSFYNA